MSALNVRRIAVSIAVTLVGVAMWSRWSILDVSLWGDEAYTAQFYIGRGPGSIFRAESYLLNNHVFFSYGEWLASKVLGTSEVVLRLGSVVPALGAIALLAVWSYRRYGTGVALTVMLLLVASPTHLLFSTQARGYGIGILVGAALLVVGVWVSEQGSRRSWLWLAATASVGITTLPHLAFQYGGHLVALLRQSGRRVGVFINGIMVSVLVALFFRQLLGAVIEQAIGLGLLRSVDNRPSKTIQITDFIGDPATLLFADWTRAFGMTDDRLVVASFVTLIVLGAWALRRRGDTAAAIHLYIPWLVFMIVLFLGGSIPRERFLSFMIGPLAVIIAIGVADLARHLIRSVPLRAGLAGVAGAVLIVAMIGDARAWGVPWENYREAVETAEGYGLDVYSNRTIGAAGFLWYGDAVEAVEDVATLCDEVDPFVLIDFPFRPQELPVCIDELATERLEVPQRHPTGPIIVWVLPGQG